MQINCIYKALPFTGFFTPNRSGTLLQNYKNFVHVKFQKSFLFEFYVEKISTQSNLSTTRSVVLYQSKIRKLVENMVIIES